MGDPGIYGRHHAPALRRRNAGARIAGEGPEIVRLTGTGLSYALSDTGKGRTIEVTPVFLARGHGPCGAAPG
jgi:hypothetical protein